MKTSCVFVCFTLKLPMLAGWLACLLFSQSNVSFEITREGARFTALALRKLVSVTNNISFTSSHFHESLMISKWRLFSSFLSTLKSELLIKLKIQQQEHSVRVALLVFLAQSPA